MHAKNDHNTPENEDGGGGGEQEVSEPTVTKFVQVRSYRVCHMSL